MKGKLIKNIIVFTTLALVAMPVMAAIDPGLNEAGTIGLGNAEPKGAIVNIIKVIMGFLGLIAVIVILIGGFKWMTAGGNEDKVAEAKKLIVAGIIGLVIILAAFLIASFVINQLLNATGA